MKEAHDRVREILTEKRDQLEVLSTTPLEKETLQGEEPKALLERPHQRSCGPNSPPFPVPARSADRHHPSDKMGQEVRGTEPTAAQKGKPEPLPLLFSTCSHGMPFP